MSNTMGATRDPKYKGKVVGWSEAWKMTDPIDDKDLAEVEAVLGRPGGSIKLPKMWVASLVVRLRNAEDKLKRRKQ